jgi:hypothetical protein
MTGRPEPKLVPPGVYVLEAVELVGRQIRYEIAAGPFRGQSIFGPRFMQMQVGQKELHDGQTICNILEVPPVR